ncbi:MAG: universal stress protein [Rhodothermales bacterium]|jgi:nucleotide-binding universal stress UspA family protein
MKSFRILVPTDFSDSALLALEHGIFLTKKFDGELVLLHVAELPTITIHDFPSDLFELAREGGMDRMGELLEKQEVALPPVKRVVLAGTPSEPAADVIVEYAKTNEVDFIVMGTHGRRGMRRLLLGSVTEEVVRRSPCPVLTTRTHKDAWSLPRADRILVPVDFGSSTRQIIGVASRMAEHYGAAITLAHVVNLEYYPYYGFGSDAYPEIKKSMIEASEEKLIELATELQGAGLDVSWKTIKGHPAAALRQLAEEADIDLIVIGSHGRSGFDRAMVGSVSEKVLRSAHCPVMIVNTGDETEQLGIAA